MTELLNSPVLHVILVILGLAIGMFMGFKAAGKVFKKAEKPNRRITMRIPGGSEIVHEYDSLGNLARTVIPPGIRMRVNSPSPPPSIDLIEPIEPVLSTEERQSLGRIQTRVQNGIVQYERKVRKPKKKKVKLPLSTLIKATRRNDANGH